MVPNRLSGGAGYGGVGVARIALVVGRTTGCNDPRLVGRTTGCNDPRLVGAGWSGLVAP